MPRKNADVTNLVAINGTGQRWKLPPDLDAKARNLARDMLQIIHNRSGVISSDIVAVTNICRSQMRLDYLRDELDGAMAVDDLKSYNIIVRLIQSHERSFRASMSDIGLNPADRGKKSSRRVAAQSGVAESSGWGDDDIA